MSERGTPEFKEEARARLQVARTVSNRTRFENGKRKREEFLDLILKGVTLADAKKAVGFSSASTYQYHRREYPLWAGQVDLARTSGRTLRRGESGEWEHITNAGDAFQRFVSDYFPDRQPHKAHQVELVNILEGMKPREIVLCLLWPEAGKTSTLEDYICKTLARDDVNHRFRIVSEGEDLSKRIVGTCVRRFTDEGMYGKFNKTFGPFYEKGQERKGRPWTTNQITTLKNSGGERDRSLVANGWTSAVYGSRIDTLILDDIQSQRNYAQAEEITRRIRGTFLNRGLEMRTLIVGTRIGPGDFYERMMEAGLVTRVVKIPAADADGNPTVPEFWDRHVYHGLTGERVGPCCHGYREASCPQDGSKLTPREFMELIRHQSGEETWWAAYQQNPTSDERSTFAGLLERCLDLDRSYGKLRVA